MPTLSDYLAITSGSYLAPRPAVYVRLVNNSTSTAYVSTGVTDANGLYTVNNVPPGLYTVYTGPAVTGPWTSTGDTNYEVAPTNLGLYNVVDYGADPTGGADSYAAILAAVNAASGQVSSTAGIVFFPAGTYKLNTALDLTSKGYVKLQGAGGGAGLISFAYPPMATLLANGPLNCVLANYGSGSAQIVFENLSFQGCQNPVKINQCASAKFINCSFAPNAGASADNCGVLLADTFWIEFDRCSIFASVNTKPSVILRGDGLSINVNQTYFVNFIRTVLQLGGVQYQQTGAPGGGVATNFLFERVDTENFSNFPLLDLTTSGGNTLAMRHIQFLGCTQSDLVGTSPYLKVGQGVTVQSVLLWGCPPAGGDAVITTGTGSIAGLWSQSPRGAIIKTPTTAMKGMWQTTDATLESIGQIGAGNGSAGTNRTMVGGDDGPALRFGVSGDANAMFGLERDGAHYWGPGGGGAAWDAKFYRKAAGSVGTDTALFCGSGATGSRPSAVTVAVGAMWFDTTLVKPIWSNGTVWKDATGATV